MKRKICIVTGSRAEYGLLFWIINEITADPDLDLQLIATGMHLSPEFGLTHRVIEEDGFRINDKIEMLLSSDTAVGVTKSLGLGVIGFAESFDRLKPHLVVVLGDRFEMLAAAQAALIARIPLAHIAGGDTTEGAFDESIRHSITKMAHLHFVTNKDAARRVLQLGENPDHIYTVGSPGIDAIKRIRLLSREELEIQLAFKFRKRNLLITFHPVTLDTQPSGTQFKELLDALDKLDHETGIIFTLPNADTGGRIIIKMIEDYVSLRPHAKLYPSMGQVRYFSAMAQVDAVVGNSSSGLYEAPTFKKPTVNIGDRQKGRIQASSVISCRPTTAEILSAINEAFGKDCSSVVNPYGDGDSSLKIVTTLKSIPDYSRLLKKHFFSTEGRC